MSWGSHLAVSRRAARNHGVCRSASCRAASSVRARVSGGASGGGGGAGDCARRGTANASCNSTRTEHRNGWRPQRLRGMIKYEGNDTKEPVDECDPAVTTRRLPAPPLPLPQCGGKTAASAATARQTLPAACPKGLRWPGGWRSANGSRSRAVRRNDTGGGSNAASAFGRSVRRNYSAVDRGGDAARLDQRIRAVQERCTALHHALRPTMGFAFVRCNGIAIVRVRYRQSLEGTEHDTRRSEERPEAPPPGHVRSSCTAHANPRV